MKFTPKEFEISVGFHFRSEIERLGSCIFLRMERNLSTGNESNPSCSGGRKVTCGHFITLIFYLINWSCSIKIRTLPVSIKLGTQMLHRKLEKLRFTCLKFWLKWLKASTLIKTRFNFITLYYNSPH